jgi:hypothetical protein
MSNRDDKAHGASDSVHNNKGHGSPDSNHKDKPTDTTLMTNITINMMT